MKLYEVKAGDKVSFLDDARVPILGSAVNQNEVLTFHRLDGMYSYCTDAYGGVYHPSAWAEVEVVQS